MLEMTDYCKQFLEKNSEFRWFIIRYYGNDKNEYLKQLATENRESELRKILNDIWFQLPDHIFNIIENPPGWNTFLEFVEE
jgi:hypothetical protein